MGPPTPVYAGSSDLDHAPPRRPDEDLIGSSFTYALAGPQVTLDYPTGTPIATGTQEFYATVSGATKVEVLAGDGAHIQGVLLGTMTLTGGYGRFSWDTTTVPPGTYPVWLRATRGGLVSTSASVAVTVTR